MLNSRCCLFKCGLTMASNLALVGMMGCWIPGNPWSCLLNLFKTSIAIGGHAFTSWVQPFGHSANSFGGTSLNEESVLFNYPGCRLCCLVKTLSKTLKLWSLGFMHSPGMTFLIVLCDFTCVDIDMNMSGWNVAGGSCTDSPICTSILSDCV